MNNPNEQSVGLLPTKHGERKGVVSSDWFGCCGHVVHHPKPGACPLAWFAVHCDAVNFRDAIAPEFTITPGQDYPKPNTQASERGQKPTE